MKITYKTVKPMNVRQTDGLKLTRNTASYRGGLHCMNKSICLGYFVYLRDSSLHTRRSTLGDRAFPMASARAWNSLPSSVSHAPSLHDDAPSLSEDCTFPVVV